ncbi:MAG: restriction endonuclease [Bernardetiaceae bacterium]|nr:restriction endonuclease [Bernardetiaceae bacterium]
MDYRLENLSEDDFEKLVNTLCQKILGIGVVSFSKGRDGGRDGRFTGTADNYPSKADAWTGQFIIQAKHTSDYNASCSDRAFFGIKTSIVNGEIEKIKVLRSKNEIDNYLLFTNRKETENRENAKKHIKQETGLENVDIIGKETLHGFLSQHEDIAKSFKLGRYAQPLNLTEFDIKEVITAFGKQVKTIKNINAITDQQLLGISKEKKNSKNSLSKDYYDNQIKGRSLQYFAQIDDFLQQSEDLTYSTR